jgi:hypothetical protein
MLLLARTDILQPDTMNGSEIPDLECIRYCGQVGKVSLKNWNAILWHVSTVHSGAITLKTVAWDISKEITGIEELPRRR